MNSAEIDLAFITNAPTMDFAFSTAIQLLFAHYKKQTTVCERTTLLPNSKVLKYITATVSTHILFRMSQSENYVLTRQLDQNDTDDSKHITAPITVSSALSLPFSVADDLCLPFPLCKPPLHQLSPITPPRLL